MGPRAFGFIGEVSAIAGRVVDRKEYGGRGWIARRHSGGNACKYGVFWKMVHGGKYSNVVRSGLCTRLSNRLSSGSCVVVGVGSRP